MAGRPRKAVRFATSMYHAMGLRGREEQEYPPPMIDPFGRPITYLRVSVTDRCDLRCVYCMAEDMAFLPKCELLTLEELDRLSAAFIRLGTTKIRITGGEPLVRRDVMTLFGRLGARVGDGVKEVTVTPQGKQLGKHAQTPVGAGGGRGGEGGGWHR